MLNKLMQIVAPHHCYSCGKTGHVLCVNCKYDITESSLDGCIVCQKACRDGICLNCQTSYSKAWVVGVRDGTLKEVIDALKFNRVKSGADTLASLLDMHLPQLPSDIIVTAVPTLPKHIRQRGYDHAQLIAKRLARYRKLDYRQSMQRIGTAVQLGANKKVRFKQASQSYRPRNVQKGARYLLIDDVVTTNATLHHCARTLLDMGAREVWVAIIAQQPLDKPSRHLLKLPRTIVER